MKKSILITCAVLGAFGLTAFNFLNWNDAESKAKETAPIKTVDLNFDLVNFIDEPNQDLVYKVEPRFMTRITKEDLHNAKSIIEILPKEATKNLSSYTSVNVSAILSNGEKTETGDNEILNPAQQQLLQSTDYSSTIWITADCQNRHPFTGISGSYDLVYYMTVIPETGAEYETGHDGLIKYLKENSKEETAGMTTANVRPSRVQFTVTKEGTLTDVILDSTSGIPSLDKKLVQLVTEMPGKWTPATNSKGEKVDETLVFFFGSMGC